MRKICLSLVFSFITILAFSADKEEKAVNVNTQSSTVKWKGSKISESHEGTVNIKKGVLIISEGLLVGGEFVFDMNSISTTDMSEKYNQKLDNHLKNEDFFNVELYPTASIVIKRAMKYKDNLYNLVGELTIKDITRPIKFQANVDINGLNFSAQSKIMIDRTKWDITYKSGNYIKDLGDKAILDEIEFDIFLLSDK
ncbi:MAG: lipid-binding protein [Flavobacteriales bacterium]|nr:lipid-binding protein [Flavobacteriales bacterium]|tara:strand:- start:89761 stop:90351 length:591 start_codon:yes stop_codon:yes gene_type:complete